MPRRTATPLTAAAVKRAIRAHADPVRARFALRYFRTGPGEYGEGDRFLGLNASHIHRISKTFRELPLGEVDKLLDSPWHEDRLVALMIMRLAAERATPAGRRALARLYLDRTDRINNWDLVDCSAPHVLGRHLEGRSRRVLTRLARSRNLWERRIAILATQWFIRQGDVEETLRIARLLVNDEQDLIHKAVGWMLREVGQRDLAGLRGFLEEHAATMPRTMLRYALEKMKPGERKKWMTIGSRRSSAIGHQSAVVSRQR